MLKSYHKLSLQGHPVYVIGPDSKDAKTLERNAAVKQALWSFKNVTFIPGVWMPRDPIIGCSLSHAIAIDQAFKNADPFLLLENDALPLTAPLVEHFHLDVPFDADAVYLGISTGGLAMNATQPVHHAMGNFYTPTEYPNLLRIYNMLSTHAVLITSKRFARNWHSCAIEAATRGVPIDTLIARTQRHFKVYAQSMPWFYQSERLGGQEKFTLSSFRGIEIAGPEDLPQQLPAFTPPCITADLAAIY